MDQNQNGKKKFRTYRDLIVWQKGMKLAGRVYAITREMPREEQFGLSAEMRRCAVSIPASIAEGYGRRAADEYTRLLNAAIGFLFALETQLALAVELGALQEAAVSEAREDTGAIVRMLRSLASKVSQRDSGQGSSDPVPTAAGSGNFNS